MGDVGLLKLILRSYLPSLLLSNCEMLYINQLTPGSLVRNFNPRLVRRVASPELFVKLVIVQASEETLSRAFDSPVLFKGHM